MNLRAYRFQFRGAPDLVAWDCNCSICASAFFARAIPVQSCPYRSSHQPDNRCCLPGPYKFVASMAPCMPEFVVRCSEKERACHRTRSQLHHPPGRELSHRIPGDIDVVQSTGDVDAYNPMLCCSYGLRRVRRRLLVQFGSKTARHFHCKQCGVTPYYIPRYAAGYLEQENLADAACA